MCAQCQLSSDQITTLTTPAATSVEEYIKEYSNQLKNVLQMCVEQQNTLPPVSKGSGDYQVLSGVKVQGVKCVSEKYFWSPPIDGGSDFLNFPK